MLGRKTTNAIILKSIAIRWLILLLLVIISVGIKWNGSWPRSLTCYWGLSVSYISIAILVSFWGSDIWISIVVHGSLSNSSNIHLCHTCIQIFICASINLFNTLRKPTSWLVAYTCATSSKSLSWSWIWRDPIESKFRMICLIRQSNIHIS